MSSLNPPNSDELIARHQFYSTIVGKSNINSKDIDGVAKKLSDFTHDFETVRDDVRATNTRNKTIIASLLFVWSIVSSGIGLYIQRSLNSFDKATARVELMEKKITNLETFTDQRKDLPDKVDSIKRLLVELERRVESIETSKEGRKK